MNNKTIGIVITDGVGSRNFLLSNFIEEVCKEFKNVIIYSGIQISSIDTAVFPANIKVVELPLYKESKTVWFFRKLKEVAHMFKHKTFYGINDNLKRGYPKNNSSRALLIKLCYAIAKIRSSERSIQFYEKLQFLSFKNDEVTKQFKVLLQKEDLDIIFFTHQRPPFLAPLLYLAQQLKIKTTSFIFSWDNLASKGRVLGEFDGYMVWSDLMKKELLYFYPNTQKNNVKVVGTPQFEPYVMDKYFASKNEFMTKFNLDPNKKIICYSCADADIGRNDEVHIRAIIGYIEKDNNLQLLIRTSPAEDGKRFVNLMEEYPNIVWNIPKWHSTRENHAESWSQRLPSVEDVIDLRAILAYSDVNVNMLSTMSLDFMLFDKPVINTVFGNKKNDLYDDQRFLNYVHYQYVVDSKAVTIAKNEEELHQQLKEAFEQPQLRTKQRKALIDLEIGGELKGTSKRIVKALKELA
ncbi:CDP-glycerol glycerophosphotransferase family protein [Polaribacter septentrionalilitoris]|uniref:CDP-glycerol glycerophosphotransferase family protein n=1 Tax=Polaribacter septentrionalilitoris TaxID=2494657 RepID=UPI00135A4CA1|nr:CDP-glycerol glycerophosphotransferase family protein [Polaribacter septentrionalilitoris]